MARGTIVAKTGIKRQKNTLYYVDGDGNVRSTPMRRSGGKKGRKTCTTPKKRAVKKAVKKAAKKKR